MKARLPCVIPDEIAPVVFPPVPLVVKMNGWPVVEMEKVYVWPWVNVSAFPCTPSTTKPNDEPCPYHGCVLFLAATATENEPVCAAEEVDVADDVGVGLGVAEGVLVGVSAGVGVPVGVVVGVPVGVLDGVAVAVAAVMV